MGASRDRFVHLAEARTVKAIKIIRLIGNLSNRNNYSYLDEDVDKVFGILRRELSAAHKRFANSSQSASEVTFSLSD